jgi:hypothetical protein
VPVQDVRGNLVSAKRAGHLEVAGASAQTKGNCAPDKFGFPEPVILKDMMNAFSALLKTELQS